MSLTKTFHLHNLAQHVACSSPVVSITDEHFFTFFSFNLHSGETFYTTICQTSTDVIAYYCADSTHVSFGRMPDRHRLQIGSAKVTPSERVLEHMGGEIVADLTSAAGVAFDISQEEGMLWRTLADLHAL